MNHSATPTVKRAYDQAKEVASLTDHFRAKCISNWKGRNNFHYALYHYYRHFSTDGRRATFQIAKDGAWYKDLPLDVEKLTVAGLRRWASLLQVPYASKLLRAQLVDALQDTLDQLRVLPEY